MTTEPGVALGLVSNTSPGRTDAAAAGFFTRLG